ncbi:MAG: hypothetical protein AB9844_00185 [Clostridiaceae bacterium]
MTKKLYIKQAALELGLTEYQLRRMTKESRVPYLMSGNRYIYDIDLLRDCLKNEALKNMHTVIEANNQYGKLRRINAD